MTGTRTKTLFFLLLGGLLVGAGQILRARAGLELDPDAVQRWVATQGWFAPVAFTLLVAGRQFVLLPSALLLTAGGLLFGAFEGTLLGAMGLVGSAAFTFFLARGIGGERVRARLSKNFPTVDRYVESAGPWLVFATVAYPAGPMTAVFWAAGFSSVRIVPLLVAVAAGGLIRAASYSFFGATLLDFGSPTFWIAAVVLGAGLLLPLLHPGLRRRLLRPAAPPPSGEA